MILYQYYCDNCDSSFEEVKEIGKRKNAICPDCKGIATKIIGSKIDNFFKPGIYRNIAPCPVYVKSREHLTEICNRMGNYNNRPFCKMKNRDIKQPVKEEKRKLIQELKGG